MCSHGAHTVDAGLTAAPHWDEATCSYLPVECPHLCDWAIKEQVILGASSTQGARASLGKYA